MYPFYTFITRINQEIKINGYIIDFSEIERVIMNFPQIKRCVCLGISKTEFIKIIVVVLTCKNSSNINTDILRRFISEYLPAYMLPHKFIILEDLPLNSSGKEDLNNLRKNITKLL